MHHLQRGGLLRHAAGLLADGALEVLPGSVLEHCRAENHDLHAYACMQQQQRRQTRAAAMFALRVCERVCERACVRPCV